MIVRVWDPIRSVGSLVGKYYKLKGLNIYQFGYNSGMSPLHNHPGDDGTTGLLGSHRVPKYHPQVEALGALDEASASLGMARALARSHLTASLLLEVQRDLYKIMTEVASEFNINERFQSLEKARIEWLESQVDEITTGLPPLSGFILPGDSVPGAALAVARTAVRRAERRVVELFKTVGGKNPAILVYLNRLSSLCFELELLENQAAGSSTTPAKP